MGALKLSETERRTEMIGCLFTREEMQRIDRIARSRGIPRSVLARIAILQDVSLQEMVLP